MRIFVNELALSEACASASPPYTPLTQLLVMRHKHPVIAGVLYCARAMPSTEVRSGVTLADVARTMPHDERRQLFAWVDKYGPFIDDDRQSIDDDLFFFGTVEVTECGLGEAARRILASHSAAVFSASVHQRSPFAADAVCVVQGFPDEAIDHVDVPNYRHDVALRQALAALGPTPTSWNDLLSQCRTDYDRLLIGTYCDRVLAPYPYRPNVGTRVVFLLGVLQRMMTEMREDGSLTTVGITLHEQYFVGKRALFTNESKTRKRSTAEFTFPDPAGSGSLVCRWHGKISTPAYRIHFEWPVPAPLRRLKVVYIGPHL